MFYKYYQIKVGPTQFSLQVRIFTSLCGCISSNFMQHLSLFSSICFSKDAISGISVFCSATSRYILILFEWYVMGAEKNAPKKVLVKLFPYIFHVKTKWNIIYKYLKTKIFSRDTNILPQIHWTSNIFGHSVTTIGIFWVSRNYPILNFKKMVCSKNIRMQHIHFGMYVFFLDMCKCIWYTHTLIDWFLSM